MAKLSQACLITALVAVASAQPFQPGQGAVPLGNLRTSDFDGPYNLTLLSAQANEALAGAYALNNYKGGLSTKDIIDFLVNVECVEGLFDTWGTFGHGFIGDLALGGPTPKGARQANISDEVRMHLMEVALNEQGHALMTRHAGGRNPCPTIDFDKGFNDLMAAAYGLFPKTTVKEKFGKAFDPFQNDQNFVLSMLTLEELGATGNKGLAGIITQPVIANAVAGLATSATAQATIQRMLLWKLRNEIVEPFGETAQQVFARVSAYRDSMDGDQIHDQGIVNTDPRFIAVPMEGVNMIPTDVRGLTYNRSPQMNLNILTIGAKDGKGGFFPEGIHGKINTPEGFDQKAEGLEDWPSCAKVAVQQSVEQTGTILPPVTGKDDPVNVAGMHQLTQPLDGVRLDYGHESRGWQKVPKISKWQKEGTPVDIADNSSKLKHEFYTCGPTCQMYHSIVSWFSGDSKNGAAASQLNQAAEETIKEQVADAKLHTASAAARSKEQAQQNAEAAGNQAEAGVKYIRDKTTGESRSVQDMINEYAKQARDAVAGGGEQAQDAVQQYMQRVSDVVSDYSQQMKDSVPSRTQDPASKMKQYMQEAKDALAEYAQLAKEAVTGERQRETYTDVINRYTQRALDAVNLNSCDA